MSQSNQDSGPRDDEDPDAGRQEHAAERGPWRFRGLLGAGAILVHPDARLVAVETEVLYNRYEVDEDEQPKKNGFFCEITFLLPPQPRETQGTVLEVQVLDTAEEIEAMVQARGGWSWR